eukprot:GHUV01044194.1.p1 GENE.GHUV01044194.1~~GHUV01044194.1.p1  ORF type:complete len:121 (+),score=9.26 GHUV01044194.1:492-854(+)
MIGILLKDSRSALFVWQAKMYGHIEPARKICNDRCTCHRPAPTPQAIACSLCRIVFVPFKHMVQLQQHATLHAAQPKTAHLTMGMCSDVMMCNTVHTLPSHWLAAGQTEVSCHIMQENHT